LAGLIILDASTLIGYLDEQDALHERAERALLAHAADAFCASVVTLAEVLVGPARRGRVSLVQQALSDLMVVPVEPRTGDEATLAELRARTTLKLPDCCVLSSARLMHADILSFDERLLSAAKTEGIPIALHDPDS
jgi:predicted nucleic acid-binding protein